MILSQERAFLIGKSLGPYEIVELLGQGGMGQVYRARDTRLERDVAIKILPREMSGDPERIARFRREARTLATLQHPHVATIHGFEDETNARFLVMELVEGEDLSVRLARGPMPVDEAIDVARQIARGLEAAHEQGVIHRDLKPANVKITPDDQVKILDFGLARAYVGDESADADPAQSPTITAGMTAAGVILGTAAYMSPEQARGKAVDKRADIWSFGVLVYEMLTGARLFAGDTVSDTLAGVLKTDIDLDTLPPRCPAFLRHLLERCLDRNPATRLRDIGEARIALEAVHDDRAPVDAPPPSSSLRWVVLAAVVGIALGVGIARVLTSPPGPTVPVERQVQIQIPRSGESVARPAIDRAGQRLVYTSGEGLWFRAFAEREGRPIPDTEGAVAAAWSPDGTWITYATLKTIYRSRPDGSRRTRVCVIETDMHPWAGNLAWSDDDRIVFTTGDAGTFSVSANGGDPRPVVLPDSTEADFHSLGMLPDGRGHLFHPHRDLSFSTIEVFDGTSRREILRMEDQNLNAVQYAAGHVLFMRGPDNPGIWAAPFSLESLAVTGEPYLVVSDASFPVLSQRGDLAFVTEGTQNGQIVRLDAEGRVTESIGDVLPNAEGLTVSPDGRQAALVIDDGNRDVWIVDLETGDRRSLNVTEPQVRHPAWSPDGTRLALTVGQSNAALRTLLVNVDGSARTALPVRGQAPQFTPDGRHLVISLWNEANEADIGVVSLDDPDAAPRMLAEEAQGEDRPAISPDGTLVAYESLETGRREVFVVPLSGNATAVSSRIQVSRDGGSGPTWSADGEHLHFRAAGGGQWMTVNVSGDPVRFGTPYLAFESSMLRAMNPLDDDTFLALQLNLQTAVGYRVWLNWAQGLRPSSP